MQMSSEMTERVPIFHKKVMLASNSPKFKILINRGIGKWTVSTQPPVSMLAWSEMTQER